MKSQTEKKNSEDRAERLLTHSPPRRVKLNEAGFGVALFAACCFAGAMIGGPALHAVASRDRARLERLRRESIATEAEVVRIEVTRGEHRRRIVHFAYEAEGEVRRGRVRLREGDRRPLAPGARIPILYVPSGRRESWIPGYEPTGTPAAVAFAVPAGLLTVAGVLARLVRCEWRLLEEGRATLGIVTRHEKVWHKTQGLRVHYEYHLLSGALRRGHIDKEKKKDAPAIGSTLVIVYDRESPSRKRLYPFQLVRCG